MFKNKYLKQLQDIQAQIRNCKASIEKLTPPAPCTFKIGHHLVYWIEAIFLDRKPNISELCQNEFRGRENETYDYLHELGEYFINIADYEKKKKQYDKELQQLQIEEGCLKRKLGID